MMICTSEIAISQENHPPLTVVGLHQITMSCSLYLTILSCQRTMRQDRIIGIGLVWAINILASCNSQPMCHLRTSFRNQQVIPTIFLIQMRTFGVSSARALPKCLTLRELLSCFGIDFTKHDGIIWIAYHIAFPVFEIERRVYTLLFQPNRFTPRSFRVF